MKALVCKEYGTAEKLVIEEYPTPEPGPDEVVVSIKAAGLNYPDNLMIQGLYQIKAAPPFIPGNEAAGVVSSVGERVAHLKPGQPVIALPEGGAFAEQCALPAARVIPLPADTPMDQAAAMTITFGTMIHAYRQVAKLQAGETVLILGAAGGVGSAAIQLAKQLGARVIAAASSTEKTQYADALGADQSINYSSSDFREALREATDNKGVDVVVDPVGGELAVPALKALAWGGRYLVIGFASGTIPDFPANLTLLKEASIQGVWWGAWLARQPKAAMENMQLLLAWLKDGRIEPGISSRFALEQFEEAFAEISERRARGKVIFEFN